LVTENTLTHGLGCDQVKNMTNLKKIIDASGLKQKWIAKRIGIDAATLSRYVSGERVAPVDVIKTVAKLLRVSQKELVG
jgi:transcriptional regulator with XRE-family HTH domain